MFYASPASPVKGRERGGVPQQSGARPGAAGAGRGRVGRRLRAPARPRPLPQPPVGRARPATASGSSRDGGEKLPVVCEFLTWYKALHWHWHSQRRRTRASPDRPLSRGFYRVASQPRGCLRPRRPHRLPRRPHRRPRPCRAPRLPNQERRRRRSAPGAGPVRAAAAAGTPRERAARSGAAGSPPCPALLCPPGRPCLTFRNSFSISPALRTMGPRTAYSTAFTWGFMDSSVRIFSLLAFSFIFTAEALAALLQRTVPSRAVRGSRGHRGCRPAASEAAQRKAMSSLPLRQTPGPLQPRLAAVCLATKTSRCMLFQVVPKARLRILVLRIGVFCNQNRELVRRARGREAVRRNAEELAPLHVHARSSHVQILQT